MSAFFAWPLPEDFRRITSPFGFRRHPVTCVLDQFHSGIDIACPQGTEVRAPCAGVIASVWQDEKSGGGLSLTILGEEGALRFGFAHLSEVRVAKGDQVERGQVVALSGGTPGTEGAGRSTGPHLHVTVRAMRSGKLLDPEELNWWYMERE